jgi:D-xylose transport system permease protein
VSGTTTEAAPSPVASDLIGSGVEGGLGDQIKAWWQRVRGGDMGALPAVGGLIVLSLLFTVLSPFFLTERNFANLLNQAAPLVVLGMALVFVLLLGEIDLSAGVTGGVGMALFVVLNAQFGIPWPLALLLGFGFGFLTGALIGFFVARVGIPSFVVTLGLFLGYQGLALVVIGPGGLFRIEVPELIALQNGNLPVWGGWVMLVIILAVSAGTSFYDRARRTKAGVPNRAISLVWIKLGVIALLGGAFVWVLSQNRGQSVNEVAGVPIIVPIVLLILWAGTFVLDRTKFGRYVYAIGGNAEAARRSGVKVRWIKWWAFVICSSLAVAAMLFSVSRVGSVDATVGRDIVLSGVAAAVVGGVSLFGGRGRLMNAAIGALVIAVITNGLGLLNLPAGFNLMVTGGVLILAATVDALSRLRAGGAMRV